MYLRMMKEITLEELKNGKATEIKKFNFLETEKYITPFIEKVENYGTLKYYAEESEQKVSDNPVYNKVHIVATLNDTYDVDNYKTVVGMVYGLDIRKPVIKFYKAYMQNDTGYLYMFNNANLDVIDLESNTLPSYDTVDNYLVNEDDISSYIANLKNNEFYCDQETVDMKFGKWLHNVIEMSWNQGYGPIKVAVSLITDAFKNIFINEKSLDYIDSSDSTSMYTIYTYLIRNISADSKDMINKMEKILLINDILEC